MRIELDQALQGYDRGCAILLPGQVQCRMWVPQARVPAFLVVELLFSLSHRVDCQWDCELL